MFSQVIRKARGYNLATWCLGFHSLEDRPFYGSTNNVSCDVKRSSFLVLFWYPLEKDQWPFALLSEKLVGQ